MGKLIVISGASGVGKGTVVKKMMARRKDLYFSVSATTRHPTRPRCLIVMRLERGARFDGKHPSLALRPENAKCRPR